MRAVVVLISVSLALVSGQAFAEDQLRANACRLPTSTLDRLAVPKTSALQLDGVSCSDVQVRPGSTLYSLSQSGELALVAVWTGGGGGTYHYSIGASWSANAPTTLTTFNTDGRAFSAYIWNSTGEGILAALVAPSRPAGGQTTTQILSISRDGRVERLQDIPNSSSTPRWVGHGDALFLLREARAVGGPSHYHLDIVRSRQPNRLETLDLGPGLAGLILRDAVLGGDDRAGAILSGPKSELIYWAVGAQPKKLHLSYGLKDAWAVKLTPAQDGVLISYALGEPIEVCEVAVMGCYGTPRRGKVAEFVDLRRGRSVWAARGLTNLYDVFVDPVISSDGKRALVSIPGAEGFGHVAYVDLGNGSSLGVISVPGEPNASPSDWGGPQFNATAGFAQDGKHVWASDGAFAAHYRVVK